ncbi:MAG TPA: NUDIX hydrolase [Gammaproteobacteria bacterium]|nr:NUDIX hydrolase [Gammaproteobacteria bacterium]
MKYCGQCGHEVVVETPPGDHLPRHVCEHCGTIHYQNPKLVVGCVPECEGKVLLCRRSIEPRAGFWTLPAGFMENGESLEQAALREAQEEALAEVELLAPLASVSVPHVNQGHFMFHGRLLHGKYGIGAETLEVDLFGEERVPWKDIAFPSVRYTLESFFADRRRGHFGFHISTWRKPEAS